MNFKDWIEKNASLMLSIMAIIGTCATAIMAASSTPKAIESKQKAQKQKGKEKLTTLEVIKAEAPSYIPAICVGIGTIGCIVGSSILNNKQMSAISGAYVLLQESYKNYQNKTQSIFGEEGDHTIRKAMQEEEKMKEEGRPPWDEVQIFYFEPYGKFFERTMNEVFLAEYHINRNLVLKQGVTINEFLDFLGLDHVREGDEKGWNLWDGEAFYGYSWIDFNHRYFTTDDGMIVCSIETPFPPHLEETEFSGEQMWIPA